MDDIDPSPQRESSDALERILQIAESERAQMSADLHSGVAQDLTGVIFKLAECQGACTDVPTSTRLASIIEHLDGILEGVRTLTSRGSPPLIEELGLPAAMMWLRDYAVHHRAVSCRMTVQGDATSLSHETAALFFRCARWLVDALPAKALQISVTPSPELTAMELNFGFADSAAVADALPTARFVAAEMIRRRGGRFECTSTPDASVFRVELPVHPTTVLLCDADANVRCMLASALRAVGFRAVEASSIEEARRALAHEGKSLHAIAATADILHVLTTSPPLRPDLKIVVLRNAADDEAPGAVGTLTKPFAPRELVEMIQRVLREKG